MGRIQLSTVYGPGKANWVEQWTGVHHFNLSEGYFYSVQTSDRPLLEAVIGPVVTNPDLQLQRLAMARSRPTLEYYCSPLKQNSPGDTNGVVDNRANRIL
jgi:phosphoserine phosphatase